MRLGGYSGNSRLAPTPDSAKLARRTVAGENPTQRTVRKSPIVGLEKQSLLDARSAPPIPEICRFGRIGSALSSSPRAADTADDCSWGRACGVEISLFSGEGVKYLSCKGRKSMRNNPRCPWPIRSQGTRPSGPDGGATEGNFTPSKGRGRGAGNDRRDSQSCPTLKEFESGGGKIRALLGGRETLHNRRWKTP